MCIIGSFAGRT
ncbi:unnamed protein product [Linum tenue]|uniref:Uncharacterized protein n=1 Tax=Linum tenue TaxID=586396 RepID=A0AAV0MYH1_9ROSI|nr:unnamed protein product [Linum tenue]